MTAADDQDSVPPVPPPTTPVLPYRHADAVEHSDGPEDAHQSMAVLGFALSVAGLGMGAGTAIVSAAGGFGSDSRAPCAGGCGSVVLWIVSWLVAGRVLADGEGSGHGWAAAAVAVNLLFGALAILFGDRVGR